MTPLPSDEAIHAALARVVDPELRRPLPELGMVKSVRVDSEGDVYLDLYLTIAACPKQDDIEAMARTEVQQVPGVRAVHVNLDVMSAAQREELTRTLRADKSRANPFTQADSLTKVFAIASGKGGVGKSSITVNIAAALAHSGLRVGIIDADIHGFSIPALLGIRQKPTKLEDMILPPVAFDIKVISIGMFLDENRPVAWRGPMLHRALEQFTKDVFFGDLDVLLLDLPPGTGDIAISVGQLLPHANIVVVTTPQTAAASVAERAGSIGAATGQNVVGVIENMAGLVLPDGTVVDVFGTGGGARVASQLSAKLDYPVPLLGSVPLEPQLREAADEGEPVVLKYPGTPASVALTRIADQLVSAPRSLAGKSLPFSVN